MNYLYIWLYQSRFDNGDTNLSNISRFSFIMREAQKTFECLIMKSKYKSCDFHLPFFSRYVLSCMFLLTTKNRGPFSWNVNDNDFSNTNK